MPVQQSKRREFSPQYSIPLVEQIIEFLSQAIMDNQFYESYAHRKIDPTVGSVLTTQSPAKPAGKGGNR